MHGSFYRVDYAMVAATPDIYKIIYHFNELQIGLSYLPCGVDIIAGGYCNGKMIDYIYKTVARSFGWKVDKVSGDDLKNFTLYIREVECTAYIFYASKSMILHDVLSPTSIP